MESIHDALQIWSHKEIKSVDFILKGESCLTEMYSCIEAEVPIPSDPSTQKDEALLSHLMSATNVCRVELCGD